MPNGNLVKEFIQLLFIMKNKLKRIKKIILTTISFSAFIMTSIGCSSDNDDIVVAIFLTRVFYNGDYQVSSLTVNVAKTLAEEFEYLVIHDEDEYLMLDSNDNFFQAHEQLRENNIVYIENFNEYRPSIDLQLTSPEYGGFYLTFPKIINVDIESFNDRTLSLHQNFIIDWKYDEIPVDYYIVKSDCIISSMISIENGETRTEVKVDDIHTLPIEDSKECSGNISVFQSYNETENGGSPYIMGKTNIGNIRFSLSISNVYEYETVRPRFH